MKKLLQRIITCVCALCLAFGTMQAQTPENEAKDAAEKARVRLKELGFQVRDTYLTGVMDNGESVVFSRTFYQDNEYVLVTTGSKQAKDIDIYVFDDDGRLIEQDADASPVSVATFRAGYTGTYYIKLVMYDAASDNIYWAFQYGYR